ncbi:MAG: FKBP-type peptidyl-prolyl cis-trans isomerase [Micrococcales bacterium]|nr:FKBP-type peptidyl-prolyl cis-trans isomerase [Micrococcales bacterium]
MHRSWRKAFAVLAVLAVATLGLGLAACGDGGSPSTSTLADVKVEGELGTRPTVVLPPAPFTVETTQVRLVADGTGAPLSDGQLLMIHLTSVDTSDGTVLETSWDSDPEPGLTVGDNPEIADLDEVLRKAHVGARVLIAAPYGYEDGPDTLLFVIDVMDAHDIPEAASGTEVAPVPGLPTVTLEDGVPASITPTGEEPPATLVVQPLIEGAGPPLTAGQHVMVQYSGWLWDGTPFDSSWSRGGDPFSLTLGAGQVISGWDEGLAGQPVGSRVLLVIPPDMGYPDGAGSIPAGATLVFVVDILVAF